MIAADAAFYSKKCAVHGREKKARERFDPLC
jgi:hypothetical protein